MGTTLRPPWLCILTYFLLSMLFMCVGMDASVPMPLRSINPMSSASDRYGGGQVAPCCNSTVAIGSDSPRSISPSGLSSTALCGITVVHPGATTVWPLTRNRSPPATSVARRDT